MYILIRLIFMISAKHLPLETVEVYLKIVKESENYF